MVVEIFLVMSTCINCIRTASLPSIFAALTVNRLREACVMPWKALLWAWPQTAPPTFQAQVFMLALQSSYLCVHEQHKTHPFAFNRMSSFSSFGFPLQTPQSCKRLLANILPSLVLKLCDSSCRQGKVQTFPIEPTYWICHQVSSAVSLWPPGHWQMLELLDRLLLHAFYYISCSILSWPGLPWWSHRGHIHQISQCWVSWPLESHKTSKAALCCSTGYPEFNNCIKINWSLKDSGSWQIAWCSIASTCVNWSKRWSHQESSDHYASLFCCSWMWWLPWSVHLLIALEEFSLWYPPHLSLAIALDHQPMTQACILQSGMYLRDILKIPHAQQLQYLLKVIQLNKNLLK